MCLQLGCGAALPSLYALKNGAEAVHFSDYVSFMFLSFNRGTITRTPTTFKLDLMKSYHCKFPCTSTLYHAKSKWAMSVTLLGTYPHDFTVYKYQNCVIVYRTIQCYKT